MEFVLIKLRRQLDDKSNNDADDTTTTTTAMSLSFVEQPDEVSCFLAARLSADWAPPLAVDEFANVQQLH